ncbi:MAG TPA: hypothetical protein DC006_03965 [Prevotellaceae bacterium]|nr:hypothetical protein [Prevotellaceae bacterium]
MNTRHLIPLLLLAGASLLAGCDSGDITETHYTVDSKGYNVKLTATLHGLSSLPAGYTLALAGFQEDDNFAVMQRAIPTGTGDSPVTLTLSNISGNVSTVEVAVTNSLRERILSLATVRLADHEGQHDTIRLDMGTLDASATGCLQRGMLDKACIQCHGANGHKAAGLDLTEGNARADLVNVPSTTRPGETLVAGGDPEGSLLWRILNDGGENLLHYNHTEIISSHFKDNLAEVRAYLRKWIEAQPAPAGN